MAGLSRTRCGGLKLDKSGSKGDSSTGHLHRVDTVFDITFWDKCREAFAVIIQDTLAPLDSFARSSVAKLDVNDGVPDPN